MYRKIDNVWPMMCMCMKGQGFWLNFKTFKALITRFYGQYIITYNASGLSQISSELFITIDLQHNDVGFMFKVN